LDFTGYQIDESNDGAMVKGIPRPALLMSGKVEFAFKLPRFMTSGPPEKLPSQGDPVETWAVAGTDRSTRTRAAMKAHLIFT